MLRWQDERTSGAVAYVCRVVERIPATIQSQSARIAALTEALGDLVRQVGKTNPLVSTRIYAAYERAIAALAHPASGSVGEEGKA